MTRAFWSNKTILQLIVEDLSRHFPLSSIVLATSVASGDDALEQLANELGIRCFRGDEEDVLDRVLAAVVDTKPEYLVRVCADNPFLRCGFIRDLLVRTDEHDYDYLSFRSQAGEPSILTHFGLFAEVVKVATLRSIANSVTESRYREHFTSYIIEHQGQFECCFLPIPHAIENASPLRLTVDTERDFEICQAIFDDVVRRYGISFNVQQLLDTINELPTRMREEMSEQIRANQK
jgi:spore coat polysaccharide biosynthesis protein SpsF